MGPAKKFVGHGGKGRTPTNQKENKMVYLNVCGRVP